MKCNFSPIKAGILRYELIPSVRFPLFVWVGICLPALVLGHLGWEFRVPQTVCLKQWDPILRRCLQVWWLVTVCSLAHRHCLPLVTSHGGEQRKEQALRSFLIRTLVPPWGSTLVTSSLPRGPASCHHHTGSWDVTNIQPRAARYPLYLYSQWCIISTLVSDRLYSEFVTSRYTFLFADYFICLCYLCGSAPSKFITRQSWIEFQSTLSPSVLASWQTHKISKFLTL